MPFTALLAQSCLGIMVKDSVPPTYWRSHGMQELWSLCLSPTDSGTQWASSCIAVRSLQDFWVLDAWNKNVSVHGFWLPGLQFIGGSGDATSWIRNSSIGKERAMQTGDQVLIPKGWIKPTTVAACKYTPNTEEMKPGRMPGLHWPGNLG